MDIKFQGELKEGDVVEARWTNSYQYFAAKARVTKKFESSVRVELLQDVTCTGWKKVEDKHVLSTGMPYLKAGHSLSLPLFFGRKFVNPKWSQNNGIFPLPEHK